MTGTGEDGESGSSRGRSMTGLEIFEAVVLALAALMTAWAAFQSTKWGGVQANSFSAAGAARTESVRASNLANQQVAIDVNTFTTWVAAIAAEVRDDIPNGLGDGTYVPVSGTESNFLYQRFRPEFRTAVDAWIAGGGIEDLAANTTPFQQSEYRIAESERADRLERQADEFAATARAANQRGDNYVMMTIVSALAIVLVSVGSKMRSHRIRMAMMTFATVALLTGLVTILTYPVEV